MPAVQCFSLMIIFMGRGGRASRQAPFQTPTTRNRRRRRPTRRLRRRLCLCLYLRRRWIICPAALLLDCNNSGDILSVAPPWSNVLRKMFMYFLVVLMVFLSFSEMCANQFRVCGTYA